jgi:hypothetical protein
LASKAEGELNRVNIYIIMFFYYLKIIEIKAILIIEK